MGKKGFFAKMTSLLLSFAMVLSLGGFICPGGLSAGGGSGGPGLAGLLSTTAYAVTGSEVAADGTYSGSSSEGTVYVAVSGGKITSVTASVKSSYQTKITSAFSSVIGKDATYANIDAVSMPTTKYLPKIKSGALSAISKAPAADNSGGGSGGDEPVEPEDPEVSEIGQGVGTKTGTKYTGRAYVNGDTTDEWVEFDVYVSGGKITGIFIAAQYGHWLDLLTSLQDSFLGVSATTTAVDAVSCATELGFRTTIQNAISNAVGNIESGDISQDSYTSCAAGTVSWQMIRDNPGTYYWIDSDGEYCALTATTYGGKYYVTLYRKSKSNGTELRYLRQDESDDSGSAHEWSGASARYTGGRLYMKGSSSASSYTVTFNYNGHGTTTTRTVTAGGKVTAPSTPTATGYTFVGWYTASGQEYDFNSAVNSSFTLYAKWNVDDSGSGGGSGSSSAVYKGSGRVSFSKDNYTFDVYVYVENGKITNITSTLTSTPQKSDSRTEYHPEAVAAILKKLQGEDATTDTVDAISSGTPRYSYAALKAAIIEALGGIVQEQQAVITMDTGSMNLTEGAASVRAVTREGCTLKVSSSDTGVATVSYNSNSNTLTVTGVSAGTATITVIGTADEGYTAPSPKNFTVTVSDGSSGTTIVNPSGSASNDLSLDKVLGKSGSGDDAAYTITLTGKATKAAASETGYTKIATNNNYTYSELTNGNYYYSNDGKNFYVLKGYRKESKKYYINAVIGSKYRGLKDDGKFSDLKSDRDEGDHVEYESSSFLRSGRFQNTYLYVKTAGTSSGTGPSAVLRDTINTSLFDLSGASVSANISGITPSLNKSTGAVTVTGYDYSGNYGKSGTGQLVVTISGLKLKSTISFGTYNSNSGNAGIYASNSSSSALVSISSPKLTIQEAAEKNTYTLHYNANGGSNAPADQTGDSVDDSYTFVITDNVPAYEGHTFLGWSENNTATTPSHIAGESITVQKASSGNTGEKTLYAVWETNAVSGKYVDGTTQMETYGYVPTVIVTVGSDGNISAITATPGAAQGYSLQLFNDALTALQGELVGKPASAATVNAFPSTDQAADAVSGATFSVNALKIAANKALQATNKIRWLDSEENGGAVLDWAWYTTGTTPFYMGDSLGDAFKEWTPEITAVDRNKDYMAVYYETADYDLNVENMTLDLLTSPLSAGLTGGTWSIKPSSISDGAYPYPVMTLTAGNETIISNSKGYKTDKGYKYTYTTTKADVAKQYVAPDGTGMPELEISGTPGKAQMELTVSFVKDGEETVLAAKSFTVTVNPCTITWNVDGAETTTLANVDSVSVSGLNPAKEGYQFLGWAADPDATEGKAESNLPKADGNTTYYAVFSQTQTEEAYADGTYGDYSGSVLIERSNGTKIADYKPIIVIMVEDGKITDVTADADGSATDRNREYMEDALAGIREQLIGKDAYPSVISGIDTVSSATVSADELKAEAAAAFEAGSKDTYTLEWDPDNGDEKTINKSVTYGTRTASLQPAEDPVKTGEGAEYTFLKWTSEADQIADPAFFVTENASYKALYDVKETADGHHIIFEDYTDGGVTIDGLENITVMEDNNRCKTVTLTGQDTVTFTLSSDIAVVAAVHTDGSLEKLMNQNGNYERLFCTKDNDSYKFTVPVTDSDLYIVLAYKGDISLDGSVGTEDASMSSRLVTGKYKGNNLRMFVGDVNHDGDNGTDDASMCARTVTGKRKHSWDLNQ